jgi:hypothetical protein
MSLEQIRFLDTFITYFGFSSVSDYNTQVKSGKDVDMSKINESIDDIKKLFKLSKLNLARKKYKIDSNNLAFSLLKNLLQQTNIPFETTHKSDANYMRLVSQNKILMNYIDNPMNNIVHDEIEMKDVKYTDEFLHKLNYIKLADENGVGKSLQTLISYPHEKYNAILEKYNTDNEITSIEVFDDYLAFNIPIIKTYDMITKVSWTILEQKNKATSLIHSRESIEFSKVEIILDDNIFDLAENISFHKFIPLVKFQKLAFYARFYTDIKNLSKLTNKIVRLKHHALYLGIDERRFLTKSKMEFHESNIYKYKFCLNDLSKNNKIKLSNKIIIKNLYTFPKYYKYIYDMNLSTINNDLNTIDNNISHCEFSLGGDTKVFKLIDNKISIGTFNKNSPIPLIYIYYNNITILAQTFELLINTYSLLEFKHKDFQIQETPMTITQIHNWNIIENGYIKVSDGCIGTCSNKNAPFIKELIDKNNKILIE